MTDRYEKIRKALAMGPWVENDNYTLAHILVSEWHGQFDLVRLVAYLLQECASTQADAARDAARYRWLRDHFRFAADSNSEIWFDSSLKHSSSGQLDAAIDAAMLKAREEA